MSTLAPGTACEKCWKRGHFCRALSLDSDGTPMCLDCEDGEPCAFARKTKAAPVPPQPAAAAPIADDGRRQCNSCPYMISANAAAKGNKKCHRCYAKAAAEKKKYPDTADKPERQPEIAQPAPKNDLPLVRRREVIDPPKLGTPARIVMLRSGGTLAIGGDFSIFALTASDRQFIGRLIEQLDDYELRRDIG